MAGYPFGGDAFSSISITDGKIASENIYNGRSKYYFIFKSNVSL